MMRAETVESCTTTREAFAKLYRDKYPKSVDCLEKSWSELTAFFKYPAAHWLHLRTTNPIESSFATVKLRTKVTKGAGSKETAAAMAFKLLQECEKRWNKIRNAGEIKNLLEGIEYCNGVVVATSSSQEAVAS